MSICSKNLPLDVCRRIMTYLDQQDLINMITVSETCLDMVASFFRGHPNNWVTLTCDRVIFNLSCYRRGHLCREPTEWELVHLPNSLILPIRFSYLACGYPFSQIGTPDASRVRVKGRRDITNPFFDCKQMHQVMWLDLSYRKITHQDLRNILKFPDLKAISLIGKRDQSISAGRLKRLVSSGIGLTRINVSHCQLNDGAICAIAQHCPELLTLNINYVLDITYKSIVTVAQRCCKLQVLNAAGLCIRTPIDAKHIKTIGSPPDVNLCKYLFDLVVVSLANNCPDLMECNFSDNAVTDLPIMLLAQNCKLTSIWLSATNISTTAVRSIAKHCSGLEVFDIAHNNILDEGVVALASNCGHLTLLNVNGCNNLTDGAIIQVARNCSRLESISIACSQLTDVVVGTLMKKCPYLTSYDVSCNISSPVCEAFFEYVHSNKRRTRQEKRAVVRTSC